MINGLNNMYTDITNLYDINADDITSTNLIVESINGQDSALFDGITSNIQDQLDSLNSGIITSTGGGGCFSIEAAMSTGFVASRFFQFGGSALYLAVNVPMKLGYDFKISAISINLAASMGTGTATIKLYKNDVAISTYIIDATNNFFNNLDITYLAGDTLNLYCSSVSSANNGNFVRATISCAVNGVQGIQGLPGTNGISFIWKGLWSNSITYIAKDVVQYNGSSYIAIASNTNSVPPSPNWNLMASKGDIGATGPQGLQGLQGLKGDTGSDGGGAAAGATAGATAGAASGATAGATAGASAGSSAGASSGATAGAQAATQAYETRVTNLETKSQNMSAFTQQTTFSGLLKSDKLTVNGITKTITLDEGKIACGEINSTLLKGNQLTVNDTTLTQTLNGSSVNINTAMAGSVTIGHFSTTNLLDYTNVNINGYLYVNGILFVPFNPSSFFSQW